VAQLAALFLKGSLWKLDLGLTFRNCADIPPLKTKIPAGSRMHFCYKETYHTSNRLVKYQESVCHSCPQSQPAGLCS